MRLLNTGFLGLLAAIALFCSGCHSAGMHAFCYHGNSTPGYFPPPAAPAASSSSSSSSSSGRWWWSRTKREHSDNGNHYGHDKQADKDKE